MPQNVQAIFFDLGDTIMDEKTEVKNASGTTLAADLFPGMADALFALHQQGYRLALVADSRPETPLNVLRQHGLLERFEHLAISENVGVQKPDPAIFLHTLEALRIPRTGLSKSHYGRQQPGTRYCRREPPGVAPGVLPCQ
jgi:FMN phosphatase YigB (HAD superfamily)